MHFCNQCGVLWGTTLSVFTLKVALNRSAYDRSVSINIRTAEPRDFNALESVENESDTVLVERLLPELWEPAPHGSIRFEQDGFVLVAEVSPTTVIGFVHVVESRGIAHLEQLSVTPEHSRRGYGQLLVTAAKDEAQRRGYERITLRTFADVPWNAPFYAKLGFVEEEPNTKFHKDLVAAEFRIGLNTYGKRVQMALEF